MEYYKPNYNITELSAIEFNNQKQLVWFDCGSGFQSTIAQQRKFDQDAGYGICSNCTGYYC